MLRIRPSMVFSVALSVVACANGFQVERLDTARRPASTQLHIVTEAPAHAYTILARFSGVERGFCSAAEPYCSLQRQALSLGADAIWIQKQQRWTRPDQWMDINGRLTRVYGHTTERIEGVLIRYGD